MALNWNRSPALDRQLRAAGNKNVHHASALTSWAQHKHSHFYLTTQGLQKKKALCLQDKTKKYWSAFRNKATALNNVFMSSLWARLWCSHVQGTKQKLYRSSSHHIVIWAKTWYLVFTLSLMGIDLFPETFCPESSLCTNQHTTNSQCISDKIITPAGLAFTHISHVSKCFF